MTSSLKPLSVVKTEPSDGTDDTWQKPLLAVHRQYEPGYYIQSGHNCPLPLKAIVKAERKHLSRNGLEVDTDHQSLLYNPEKNDVVSFQPTSAAHKYDSTENETKGNSSGEGLEINFKTEPVSESDPSEVPQAVQHQRPGLVNPNGSAESALNTASKIENLKYDAEESEDHGEYKSSKNPGISTASEHAVTSKPDCPQNIESVTGDHKADLLPVERTSKQEGKQSQKEKNLQCAQCPSVFPCVSHLNRHLQSHTQVRPFACTSCPARFKLRCHLKQHTVTHTGEKPYPCQECTATFSRSEHLKQHVLSHRGLRPYLCTVCNTAFTQAAHLRKHVIRHRDDRVVCCKIKACKAVFNSVSALQKHKETHVQDRKCRECSVVLSRADDMKKHMRIHTKDKPFTCPSCPARFTQAAHLATHKLQHTDQKPFQCVVCGSGFRQSHHLKRHMEVHNGEKPLSCKVCSASFRRRSSLTRHQQKCHRVPIQSEQTSEKAPKSPSPV